MLRQLRCRRRQPVEEQLDRRARTRRRLRQPHARRAQPRARDVVDEIRIEILHDRVAVAVERVRAHRRQRRRDQRELLLDRVVDRRRPEREPLPLVVFELRVDETFGDRALGELDDREHRARGAAELDAGGRRVREADQLADAQLPGRDGAPELREIRDRRHPDVQVAGRKLALRAPGEDIGRRVRLPEHLEGRQGRNKAGNWELLNGHDLPA